MIKEEICWYKGKYKVKVLKKSKKNYYLVEALEDIPINVFGGANKGAKFEIFSHFLWRKQK